MSAHPNVDTVDRMTKAIFAQDHDALASIFTDDLLFHLRGPHPMAGDHPGLGGFLGVLGSFFEMTGGRIKLDQQFCLAADGWAAEWEHATLGRARDDETTRVAQRLRVPVRRCSHRRDVDVPRRAGRSRRGLLRLTAPLARGKTVDVVDAIEDARAACDGQRWGDAWRLLSAVEIDGLDVDDLDRLATAAYLTGHDEEGFAHWVRAHQLCVASGEVHRAAHFGVKLAQGLGFKGDLGRCRGWVDRTARLLEDARIDCVEQGYLGYGLGMLRIFEAGDMAGAHTYFVQAGKVGARFADRELITLARIGEGRMLVYLGEIAEGMSLLDEAMVSIEAGELSPMAMGDAYCTVIDACAELFDLARCRSWTESFQRWCDTQQELVLYRGHCFLHRAEVLGLLGRWPEALVEARSACDRLAAPVNPAALGAACAIEGDLLRLVGDLDDAEAAYERASEIGHDPQPGLALLRLAQGRLEAADAMARRALGEAADPFSRARLLGSYVEIVLAAGDTAAARMAADELRAVAAELQTPLLRAHAERAAGAVLLAEGDAKAGALSAASGLQRVQRACRAPRGRPDSPIDRGGMPRARRPRRGRDGSRRWPFGPRGAPRSTSRDPATRPASSPEGLTQRELEVLRLLAGGKSNRVIAQELVVSEKTVASHVSHIFTKLGLGSRSAATAYAYEHDLV